MGILNVTPDSFYDGGKYEEVARAVTRAAEMVEQGAHIIDIGGESTGPGSSDVSIETEVQRVLPVVQRLRSMHGEVHISVDTYKAQVAQAALEAGATMINDVTAGRGDANMFAVIARAKCLYIMMHSKDSSARTTVREVEYSDVIADVQTFLKERIGKAQAAGIEHEQIILDPGLGHFVSADARYSWEILERLDELCALEYPVLVSPSRKSFTGKTLEGTLRATAMAIKQGASIVRTHDVAETLAPMRKAKQKRHRLQTHNSH